jgi:putative DNA primase/helicase
MASLEERRGEVLSSLSFFNKPIEHFLGEYLLRLYKIQYLAYDSSNSLGYYILNEKEGYYENINEDYLDSLIEKEFDALAEDMLFPIEVLPKKREHLALKQSHITEVKNYIRRRTYQIIGYETSFITFHNCFLNWDSLMKDDFAGALWRKEHALGIPFSFNYIPHDIEYDLLNKLLNEYVLYQDIKAEKELLEKELEHVVNIFKEWVKDNWLILFEIIGYCTIPKYPLHKAFMLLGSGSNGKSTFLNTIITVLDKRNVSQIPLQEFDANYRFSLINLKHKLANIFADLPGRPLEFTGYFKALTGEDYISADRKFKERISFINYAKLLFSTNQLIRTNDISDAFFRRWILIEFPNVFNVNGSNWQFIEKNIKPHTSKILTLSIFAMFLALKRGSFSLSDSQLKEKWLRLSDSVYAFIRDEVGNKLEEGSSKRIPSSELYNIYVEYCNSNDYNPISRKAFHERMNYYGYVRTKIEGIYVYKGIGLKEESKQLQLQLEPSEFKYQNNNL